MLKPSTVSDSSKSSLDQISMDSYKGMLVNRESCYWSTVPSGKWIESLTANFLVFKGFKIGTKNSANL